MDECEKRKILVFEWGSMIEKEWENGTGGRGREEVLREVCEAAEHQVS